MDTVLMLPLFHPDLNPIEKMWAIVKNRIALLFGDVFSGRSI